MAHDDAYLVDILDAAKLALAYVSDKTKAEFDRDIQCQDAVIRRLEIIGKAARRVTEQTRAKFPLLPWNAMMNMRNVLIHEYDDVDFPALLKEHVGKELELCESSVYNVFACSY